MNLGARSFSYRSMLKSLTVHLDLSRPSAYDFSHGSKTNDSKSIAPRCYQNGSRVNAVLVRL
jgi:hypothetical protein